MEKIILLGGGGHCKSVIDAIRSLNLYDIYGIIDIEKNIGQTICGINIIDCDKNLNKYRDMGIKKAFITIGSVGNSELRVKLYNLAFNIGFEFPIIADKTAIISESVHIGKGTFIGKGAIINADSSIGENCIVNTGSIIEHDCTIGDFVHISPGATVCGGVVIGNNTHIGANSTVLQYRKIGNDSIIGAGSIVTKDVKSNITAYGNPCREVC